MFGVPTLQEYIDYPELLVNPKYTIYKFTDQIYKINKFANQSLRIVVPRSEHKHSEKRLDSSMSRTRRILLEYALCNDWTYFCTFTLDKSKYDRFDLLKFKDDLSRWLVDYRKKLRAKGSDIDIRYCLVPEMHKDGAWHMHGFFSDISPLLVSFEDLFLAGVDVPYDLVEGGYYNWGDYAKKFGFCSFDRIRNKVATAFYATKYVTKSVRDAEDFLGKHILLANRGLCRACLHGTVYQESPWLDSWLTNDYEFVKTGMTHVEDGLDWSFAFGIMYETSKAALQSWDLGVVEDPEVDKYYEVTQTVIDGF